MGTLGFWKCSTSPNSSAPDPTNWELVQYIQFEHAYVLEVNYPNCTNFEGNKVLVYLGIFDFKKERELDPHFSEERDSPIARFKPTNMGRTLAYKFAKEILE